ncbi:NIPSNAP family protein [Streptomyces sp. NPDC057580]|uniref:NIPSNAP family protein n=1 Tax=Streptomyces sp. NPDC057580 TaxID=3346173 RepID=UPI00368B8C84
MSGVQILDTVVLPDARVAGWLRRWRTEYLPGARDRGMVAERVWRTWTGPDTAAVRILWSLPDSDAFYAARGASGRDPGVAAFWAHTDEIALDRDRQVLEPIAPADEGPVA